MSCLIHSNPLVAGQCITCQKNICPDCIKEFGYYCSSACKLKAQSETIPLIDREEKQKLQNLDRKVNRLAVWITWILPISFMLGLGLFLLIKITDRSGKLKWEITLEEDPVLLQSHRGV